MKVSASYELWDSPRSSGLLGCWEEQLGAFREWFGYSHLGNAFLRDPSTHMFAVVYPFRAMQKQYGPFASVRDFERAVLIDPGFEAYCLRPAHVGAIQALLGPLPSGKVYIPGPYPHLGGTEEPNTYSIGDFCVFMELVGQTHGFP